MPIMQPQPETTGDEDEGFTDSLSPWVTAIMYGVVAVVAVAAWVFAAALGIAAGIFLR